MVAGEGGRGETVIRLTASEMMLAAQAGIMRTVENVINGAKSAHGADADGIDWTISIEGCIAEWVASRIIDSHWYGKGQMRGEDVGGYQVRSTAYENGCLILHEEDKDDAPYILLIGKAQVWKGAMGWMYGRDGKDKKYWRSDVRKPAFFVPVKALQPMDTLPRRVK